MIFAISERYLIVNSFHRKGWLNHETGSTTCMPTFESFTFIVWISQLLYNITIWF